MIRQPGDYNSSTKRFRMLIAGHPGIGNPELYKGILNTMVTQILSTGTRMYTDPLDGSFVFETDDGDAAVKITGNGILISDEKRGDEFVWTTALNGGGMAADVINTGVLKASLVKILGTDAFYWDSQAIFIFDENDATKNRQIRIGKYDGKNYGIGYTTDPFGSGVSQVLLAGAEEEVRRAWYHAQSKEDADHTREEIHISQSQVLAYRNRQGCHEALSGQRYPPETQAQEVQGHG